MEVIFDTSRLGGFVSSQGTTCRCESLPYVRPIKFFFLIFFPTSSKKGKVEFTERFETEHDKSRLHVIV